MDYISKLKALLLLVVNQDSKSNVMDKIYNFQKRSLTQVKSYRLTP